jgi:hypothetical protein
MFFVVFVTTLFNIYSSGRYWKNFRENFGEKALDIRSYVKKKKKMKKMMRRRRMRRIIIIIIRLTIIVIKAQR